LRFYQQQVQIQNRPGDLFEQIPVLPFRAEQKRCPIDGCRLQVLKSQKRTIKALGIGTFQAHHTLLFCRRHPELGVFRSKALDELVAPNSNVAYTVLVEIGRLRFLEKRQIKEIQAILLQQHSVALSKSETALLVDKFVFYLALVHQESTPLIQARINTQGGYILHVDATCEADSPKLVSGLDSISGFVLCSAKLTSENKEEVARFLGTVREGFGTPHAVVSDMSKGISSAIEQVFGDVPHYICQFHFLRAIGKFLFEKEHDALRKALSKAGISGKLKQIRKTLIKSLDQLFMDKIETYLEAPSELGRTREGTRILAFYLILWILDHASQGDSYGFPFDQRYLNFYERLKAAHTLINKVKAYYPIITENDRILWKLYHLIDKIVADAALENIVNLYRTKLAVFSDLRTALRMAPKQVHNGLTQPDEITSSNELKIKVAVGNFIDDLEPRIQHSTDEKIKQKFIHVKERIEQYWGKLFADPVVVHVKGQEKLLFVQRTNNFVENHFRQLSYGYRRIHGNRSVRRNLDNIPEQLPLTENLKNPNYVKLVFEDEFNIAKRFSQIDVQKIRQMTSDHHRKKQSLGSRKIKRIIRQTEFKDQLLSAFAVVAG